MNKLNLFKKIRFLSFFNREKKYTRQDFQKDLIAGLTVAIIAVPQSMAYALIAGIDPKYGLYAAAIPVIIASLFGSSRYLIAGPTNALAMMTASITGSTFIGGVLVNNMGEQEKIAMVFLIAFLAGVIQIAFGFAKLGSLINFVSHSVVIAFTAGAGVLIAGNQLKNLFGISLPSGLEFFHVVIKTFESLPEFNPYALAIGLYTILLVITLKRYAKKIPGPLTAVVTSGLLVLVLGWSDNIKLIGEIPRTLPPLSGFPFDFHIWRALLFPSLAIAILGIIEATSIAKSIANFSNEKINGNQELFAQGAANIAAAFTSGMPGTGSFTRSAINYQSGAATRFAGIYSGIFVILMIVLLAPFSRFIPMASLAGILIVIAYGMIDKAAIKMAWKATSSDRIIIAITFISTLILELEKAVYIGVLLSVFLFLKKASCPQVYRVVPREKNGRMMIHEKGMSVCPQITIFQIDGAFFFGAVNEIEERFSSLSEEFGSTIILRLRGVRLMDATGAHAMEKFIKNCQKKNIHLIITNVKPTVEIVMKRIGLDKLLGEENITEDTTAAIELAIKKYTDKKICANCTKKIFGECQGVSNN